MSTQQLAEILAISAQNPPAGQRHAPHDAGAEGMTRRTPLAEAVKIARANFGPCQGDLILPEGGDASQLIIHYHGGGFFLFSAQTYRRPPPIWRAQQVLWSSRLTSARTRAPCAGRP
jgi:epsilon-lactone hydrolase